MSKQDYEFHSFASVLPLMGQIETDELAADIQGNGLREPIVLFEGRILDGRNRYRACKIVGVEPRFKEFNGEGDPVDFIVSVNIKRRHLTTAQRQMVAAKLANLPRGDKRRFAEHSSQTAKLQNGKTVAQAAKELEVSPRGVMTAKEVLRTAPPEEIEKIERGEKTVSKVAREVKEKASAKEKHLDKTGYPIPDVVLADWREAESLSPTLNQLHRIKLQIEKSVKESDLAFREITNSTVSELENVWRDLQRVVPYAICPTCQGRTRANCTLCKQRGWISKFGYETWVPEATRTIREKAIKK